MALHWASEVPMVRAPWDVDRKESTEKRDSYMNIIFEILNGNH